MLHISPILKIKNVLEYLCSYMCETATQLLILRGVVSGP